MRIASCRVRHRGIALMLVITVMGLATIMGLAMLTSASLQRNVQSNSSLAAEAQYLAESGVNLAIFYLQHPEKAPSLVSGYYNGQTGVSLGSSVSGTIDVSVANPSKDIYDITSTGYAGPNPAARASRQIKTRVQLQSEYQIKNAASFSGDYTVPALMTITGSVRADGNLQKLVGGTITGAVAALVSNVTGATGLPTYPTKAVPALSEINLYTTLSATTPYYTYTDSNGVTQTGTPQVLPATVTGTLSAAANNPKNVWYSNNNVTLGDCTVNGTIVLKGANKDLTITGVAHVTPHSGMPGVIVSGAIKYPVSLLNKSLTVDGLLWMGGDILASTLTALNCSLTVNGAFMSRGTHVDTLIVGTIGISYVAANVSLGDFTDVDRVPQNVKIIHWGM